MAESTEGKVAEFGSGAPLVLIPGIQGRWEWMQPGVVALSRRHRVLTFTLGETERFDDWIGVIDGVVDRAGEAAVIAGVSFGGLIALHYAARRPERTRALVLVSPPAPECCLDRVTALLVRHPYLGLPFFSVRGFFRLVPEILIARPTWRSRMRLGAEYAVRVLRAPVSPGRMARHVNAWRAADLTRDCARVTAPTLVVTGEPRLDRVVRVGSSVDYVSRIAGARHVTLDRTGHVGLITTSDRFADVIDRFLDAAAPLAPAAGRLTRHAS